MLLDAYISYISYYLTVHNIILAFFYLMFSSLLNQCISENSEPLLIRVSIK